MVTFSLLKLLAGILTCWLGGIVTGLTIYHAFKEGWHRPAKGGWFK
jgi:hypothetical protein